MSKKNKKRHLREYIRRLEAKIAELKRALEGK
jgi:hypothetical protein